jgi:hypothetical protein
MRSIEDFSIANYFLKRYYTKDIEVFERSDHLEDILKKHPKLVVAINHGSAAAPAPVISGVFDNFLKSGGADRKPLLIVWRAFYKVPILKYLIKYISQVDGALSAAEFLHKFQHEGFTDLFVLPEGENCMFGDNDEITPFLSPKFIEFAVRAKAPVLVVAHEGTEKMSTPYIFEDKQLNLMRWLPQRQFNLLKNSRVLNYPHLFETDIDKVRLYYRLFHPALTEAQLSKNENIRKEQLQEEANKVYQLMSAMKKELFSSKKKKRTRKAISQKRNSKKKT